MRNSSSIVPSLYRSDDYIKRLSCSNCRIPYSYQMEYIDLFCSECTIKNYNKSNVDSNIICGLCKATQTSALYCSSSCGSKVSDTSIKVRNYENFIKLPCSNHPNERAERISNKYLQLYCSSCKTIDETQPVKYSLIENKFKDLFLNNFKKFCYERKRKLITFKLFDMLEVCRWMNQINEGLVCVTHPETLGIYIDKKMNTLCRSCHKNQAIKIDDIEEVAEMVIEIARKKARECKPNCFNKYMIKTVNYFRRPEIRTKEELRLLVLEARDFLNEVDFQQVRCVKCFNKISVGKRVGVENSCSHVICFNCYMSNISSCPIDDQNIQPKQYCKNSSLNIPTCHGFHEFGIEHIYKLPCFHFSCEKHTHLNYCRTCGFKFSVLDGFKKVMISETSRNLIDFFYVRCTSHQSEKIEFFSINPMSLHCTMCRSFKMPDVKLPLIAYPIKIKLAFLDIIFDNIEKFKDFQIDPHSISAGMLKIYAYLRVLDYQMLVNFFNILRTRNGFLCLESVDRLILFDVFQSKSTKFYEYFKVKEDSRLVFTLTMNEDMIFSGFILNKIILSHTNTCLNLNVKKIEIKCFRDKSRNHLEKELKISFGHSQNLDDFSECFFLSNSVYLKEMQVYDFYVPIPSGYHYWSKPFSKIKTEKFLIEKGPKNNFRENDIDGNFGGVLRGLMIKGVMDFFKKENS